MLALHHGNYIAKTSRFSDGDGITIEKAQRKRRERPVPGKSFFLLFFSPQGTLTNGRIDLQFDVQLGQASPDLERGLAQSKRIELQYSLIVAGRATTPPLGDFSDLLRIFPTTFAVEVFPPYLIIRVREMPLKP